MSRTVVIYVFDKTDLSFGDPGIDEEIGNKVVTWRRGDETAPVDATRLCAFDGSAVDIIEDELIREFGKKYPKAPKHEVTLRLRLLVRHNRLAIKQGKKYQHSQAYNHIYKMKIDERSAKLQLQL